MPHLCGAVIAIHWIDVEYIFVDGLQSIGSGGSCAASDVHALGGGVHQIAFSDVLAGGGRAAFTAYPSDDV